LITPKCLADLLRERRLEAVLRSSSHKTAEEIIQAILDEVSVFVNAKGSMTT